MRMMVLLPAVIAMLVAMLPGTPAQAVNNRSWVASYGSGTACLRSAPCADFQTAHDVTLPGGEIDCVDAGEFTLGNMVITKSITIDCGGMLAVAANIFVNGAGIVVQLRNLTFSSLGNVGYAITFQNGAALYVENCAMRGYQGAGGRAIHFAPPDGVTAKLQVTDSIFNNNGDASGGGGIVIAPVGSGSARVTLERSHFEGNTYGIVALGSGSTGPVLVHVKDSVVTNNVVDGIGAYTSAGQSTVSITVDHSSSLLNGGHGIVASGPSAFVVLASSTVMSNVTGLSSSGGGTILSYQDNHLAGNTTDGAPTGMLSLK